ncbi:MAG: AAA family ATPase, partial [Desulfobacterales bacterium]|nr:AAA family ATPase [Desulfobacterales bacterium]
MEKKSFLKGTLPIGVSDFKKLREENRYYVDKSLLIQKVWEAGSDVLLFPRPRRFGKTLNLSMLRYFFEKTDDLNASLFNGLFIFQQPEMMAHQGQYPLIYLTFKDVKEMTWDNCLSHLRHLLVTEWFRVAPLIK